jgi:hypothetical protein
VGRGQVHLEEALSSPRNKIQSPGNHLCRLTKRFSTDAEDVEDYKYFLEEKV